MGQIATCTQFFDDRFVARNELFQKFLIPRQRRYTMGAHLYRDERFDFYVSFYHSVGRAPFSQDQCERAQTLVPHLQHMARLLVRHEVVCGAADAGERALDVASLPSARNPVGL